MPELENITWPSLRGGVLIGMKRRVQGLTQRLLGLQLYLFLFSAYAMAKMRWAEPGFFRFLRLIPDEGLLLDIGANLGVTTSLLARRCPHARILAFEPVPWNVANIRRMAELLRLRNISIQDCAAGNRNGMADFVIPVVGGGRMHALGHLGTAQEEGEHFPIRCRRLDDLALSRVTAIKIDVENSEFAVLSGGIQLLSRWQPLIYCELWDNENRKQSFELLGSLGYVPYTLRSGRMTPFDAGRDQAQNFIFLPQSSRLLSTVPH